MTEENNKLQPILKHKSKLKEKQVNISGNNDFGSISDVLADDSNNNANAKSKKNPINTTQRVSNETVEKLKLLYFFFPKETGHVHTSFNDILNDLMDDYINNKLTDRQRDMFNQMLNNIQ
ncbi:LtrC [Apilactobacillus sp. TMW 2.2459]|uniref:LtrC n=1 Tax=Apilactobacillus xinyiensis TaxID=2841032 RepID=UPI00200BAAB3|nr:LtrC [Apilactobacillus xinyiensis]MCL0312304.1 LtrC [Apilactobacillus xinyiensis]